MIKGKINSEIKSYLPLKYITLLLFTINTGLGTFLHELGHYLTAQLFNVKSILHFNRVSYHSCLDHNVEYLLTSMGILSTLLIGTSGLLLAHFKRVSNLGIIPILFVSLAFFWSRQIVIMTFGLIGMNNSDEISLARRLLLPKYTFAIPLGIIGLIVCTYCVFIIIPRFFRVYFLTYGFSGCIIGYFLWFKVLGPYLLP